MQLRFATCTLVFTYVECIHTCYTSRECKPHPFIDWFILSLAKRPPSRVSTPPLPTESALKIKHPSVLAGTLWYSWPFWYARVSWPNFSHFPTQLVCKEGLCYMHVWLQWCTYTYNCVQKTICSIEATDVHSETKISDETITGHHVTPCICS